MIPDQTKVWDKKHGNNEHEILRDSPSPLAELTKTYLPVSVTILELGCGVGRDARYFATLGHTVLATDSSTVAIHQNLDLHPAENVSYEVFDLKTGLPTADKHDAIYANLSLHYFTDADTKQIFKNIAASLVPDGILAFACKSKDSFRTDGAEQVEKNVFVAPNGHAMHLFSIAYAQEVLGDAFKVLYIDEINEEYMGRTSDIVRCIAKVKSSSF